MGYGKINGRVKRVGCLVLLALAGAPARSADPATTIRLLAAQDAAMIAVGERLSVAARALCRPGGWAAGLVVQTRSQYGVDYRDVASRVLGLGDYPTVTFVIPGGAADRAGLAAGDQIVAVDSRDMSKIAKAAVAARIDDTERALDAIDTGLSDGDAELRILRRGAPSTIRLRAQPACRARFEVRAGADTDANASRDRVQVSSDLVDPARADQDLAPLVAHELSHVILGHEDALRRSRRGLLPGFGKGGAALRASEIAADRLSVYLLALAGYRPSDAISFWTAFGRRTDVGILSDRTHPDWRTRVAAIRVEVSRVAAQQAAGRAVTPPADLIVTPSR